MSARVYVCASSDELDRAAWAMERVRAAGWELTLDWVVAVRAAGAANPTDVPRFRRKGWAYADADAVRSANAVWMLAPEAGAARGAFWELGFAYALAIPCVVSGPTHACSIFTALATEVDSDAEALDLLRAWLTRPAASLGGP